VGTGAAFVSVVSEPPPLPGASRGRTAVVAANRHQRRRDEPLGGDNDDDA